MRRYGRTIHLCPKIIDGLVIASEFSWYIPWSSITVGQADYVYVLFCGCGAVGYMWLVYWRLPPRVKMWEPMPASSNLTYVGTTLTMARFASTLTDIQLSCKDSGRPFIHDGVLDHLTIQLRCTMRGFYMQFKQVPIVFGLLTA